MFRFVLFSLFRLSLTCCFCLECGVVVQQQQQQLQQRGRGGQGGAPTRGVGGSGADRLTMEQELERRKEERRKERLRRRFDSFGNLTVKLKRYHEGAQAARLHADESLLRSRRKPPAS